MYLLLYCIYKKNFPKVYPRVILPGFIAGLMWSVATAFWFVANKVLSEAVAFPIVSTGPGIITAILGVFIFHEIKVRDFYSSYMSAFLKNIFILEFKLIMNCFFVYKSPVFAIL